MRVTIERLRSWILVLAVLLVAGILLFLGYARWRVRRIARDLPGKLGISVQQSTTGFTFAKSDGKHTLFTVHAAKMVQYKGGGHAELHDASITLYNADGAPADRIYGNDFDYDPVSGIVRANGAVQIDLQGPAASGSSAETSSPGESDRKNVVHVKTADLVFNQKTGLASTPKRIEFRIAQAAGNATGASFNSRAGTVILERDVAFDSSLDGSPLTVRARHAQYDRASRLLYLWQDAVDYNSSHSSSDQATVHFREDGSAFRIESQGHVTTTNGGQKVASQSARIELGWKSEPEQAVLSGGVLYIAEDAARHLHGSADSGILSFGPKATIRHAQLRNTVSIADEEKMQAGAAHRKGVQDGKPQASRPLSTTRDVEASQIDVDFSPGPDRRPVARKILAVGGARLNIHTLYASGPQTTGVQGDRLLVTLRDGVALSALQGTGHTKLLLVSPNGVTQTSTGDNLRMSFASAAGTIAPRGSGNLLGPQQAALLESSEQQGNVTLVQQHPAAGAPPVEITARAERAVYEAATQLVTLSGGPRIQEADGELTAATIAFERITGNATAAGGVKATYRQSAAQAGVSLGGSEPVHVVADHAHLDHVKDLAIFYGKAAEDARLWQGADSISAPVLELSRSQQTLEAHGEGGSGVRAVHAVFTSVGGSSPKPAEKQTAGKPGQDSVMRVNSRTLLYSDAQNKAVFRGGVVAQDQSGTMRANGMDVYFGSASGTSPGAVSVRSSARVKPGAGQAKVLQRIVAQDGVEVEQPGRKATGSELVYTAGDGSFRLTGTSAAPPHLVDQAHGTVTGAALIFNDRDDSVVVSGGPSGAVTKTRVAK